MATYVVIDWQTPFTVVELNLFITEGGKQSVGPVGDENCYIRKSFDELEAVVEYEGSQPTALTGRILYSGSLSDVHSYIQDPSRIDNWISSEV